MKILNKNLFIFFSLFFCVSLVPSRGIENAFLLFRRSLCLFVDANWTLAYHDMSSLLVLGKKENVTFAIPLQLGAYKKKKKQRLKWKKEKRRKEGYLCVLPNVRLSSDFILVLWPLFFPYRKWI